MGRGQPAVTRRRAQSSARRSPLHPAGFNVVPTAMAGLLLVLLAAGLAAHAAASGAAEAHGRPWAARSAAVVLVVRPRTLTQTAHVGALRVELTASPLVPGPNRLVVTLVEHGRAVSGAQVRLRATMVGMIMRPIILTAMDHGRGRYSAVAPLSMFGSWQLTICVQRRHQAPLAQVFGVSLELPADAVRTLAAGRTRR